MWRSGARTSSRRPSSRTRRQDMAMSQRGIRKNQTDPFDPTFHPESGKTKRLPPFFPPFPSHAGQAGPPFRGYALGLLGLGLGSEGRSSRSRPSRGARSWRPTWRAGSPPAPSRSRSASARRRASRSLRVLGRVACFLLFLLWIFSAGDLGSFFFWK